MSFYIIFYAIGVKMQIGYARVSTLDQNLDLQIDALNQAGCKKIFQDKITGTKLKREQLQNAIDYLRAGDVLVIWKLDRLGRSLKDLLLIVNELNQKEIGLKSLHENIDTTTPTGKLIFHIFASLAEFEKDVIKERTNAGLKAARARGRVGGRPKKLTDKQLTLLKTLHQDKNTSLSDISNILGISKKTIYNYLNS
ncbi:recombinase family protein [Aliarcobacter cryaerophilus]|uniref:recombinase family protein n=1 Tax=Aliarcobacter cryaerophilus TaxID=28198 RepID=UPI003DA1CC34